MQDSSSSSEKSSVFKNRLLDEYERIFSPVLSLHFDKDVICVAASETCKFKFTDAQFMVTFQEKGDPFLGVDHAIIRIVIGRVYERAKSNFADMFSLDSVHFKMSSNDESSLVLDIQYVYNHVGCTVPVPYKRKSYDNVFNVCTSVEELRKREVLSKQSIQEAKEKLAKEDEEEEKRKLKKFKSLLLTLREKINIVRSTCGLVQFDKEEFEEYMSEARNTEKVIVDLFEECFE